MTLLIGRPCAADERGVGLDHALVAAALAQLILQRYERRALPRDQQEAGGFLVEPVHQFEKARVGRAWRSCSITPELTTAAAVHRHAGRLVDGEQVLVLEHDRELARRCRGTFVRSGGSHRRDAHFIAEARAAYRRRHGLC